MTDDALIDRFVETLNALGLEPLPEDEVPAELRTGPPDQFGWCQWEIRAAGPNPWVAGLEESVMPHHFPKPFLSLISRYRFAEFEVGQIMFFANTGQPVSHELAVWKDRFMTPVLLEQGLLQFGQPDAVNYDPICFATAKMRNGDAPIVQIDHEDILSRNRNGRIVAEIAPTFRHFVEQVIAGAGAKTDTKRLLLGGESRLSELREQIQRSLMRLTERERQILTAILFHGADRDEVCREFGMSRDHLRVLLHRAFTKIRRND
jgi:hypothetical protein